MRLESKGLPDAMDGVLCLATVLRVLHFGIADFARLDRSGRVGQPCQPIFFQNAHATCRRWAS